MEANEVLDKVNDRLADLEYASSLYNKKVANEVWEIRKMIIRYQEKKMIVKYQEKKDGS